jgi:hypothetical protein
VIAREAVLNNPEIVRLLREHFVCLAVDNADNLNLTPADQEWLKDRGGRACTQGMAVFTAGGTLLGQGGGYQPGPVQRMLEDALAKFQPEPSVAVEDTGKDSIPRPPRDGLVLVVTWKILAGARAESSPTSGDGVYDQVFLDSLGVDRLWVRKDEAASLVEGGFPESLRRRMAPHLDRVLPGGLRDDLLTLRNGRLEGSYLSNGNDRADALGFIESRDGHVTRFDLIVRGLGVRATDHGFSAGLTIVPQGEKVPVALSFMLADPKEDLSRTPPYHVRATDYLE